MAGERTPGNGNGDSSDDDISLREHLQRQIDLQRDNGLRMFAEFRTHYDDILGERKDRVDARFEAMSELLSERFSTQTVALSQALANADAITRLALEAAKEAVNKAEVATEKRFEGVNEFRAALGDQASRLMPRSETEVRLQGLAERVDVNTQSILTTAAIQADRIGKLELDVRTQLALSDGKGTGLKDAWGYIIGAAGFAALLVSLWQSAGK